MSHEEKKVKREFFDLEELPAKRSKTIGSGPLIYLQAGRISSGHFEKQKEKDTALFVDQPEPERFFKNLLKFEGHILAGKLAEAEEDNYIVRLPTLTSGNVKAFLAILTSERGAQEEFTKLRNLVFAYIFATGIEDEEFEKRVITKMYRIITLENVRDDVFSLTCAIWKSDLPGYIDSPYLELEMLAKLQAKMGHTMCYGGLLAELINKLNWLYQVNDSTTKSGAKKWKMPSLVKFTGESIVID